MSRRRQDDEPGPWILFPEIIPISVVAVLLPLPFAHMLLSGQALAGIVGLAFWLVAVLLSVHFVRRRRYWLVLFPMLAMVGLFFAIQKLCK
jgi:hypothetical protein